ncbi:hypothetical protein [Sulfuricurvum sp.]|uniref:hypothetical protein n=1 Tax=Sulfuricurvum sp. TaxID=2025608 RepID=UPI002D583514|nr:hypothetical protein [Sulfuricurvum sp.]HZF69912.1 hypothetical protein [Sulfuricurvum sp.]
MMFEARIVEALDFLKKEMSVLRSELSDLRSLFHSDFATIDEVASIKGVSAQAIRKKIANGDIDPMHDIRKNGRITYIRRTAIPSITVRKKHN